MRFARVCFALALGCAGQPVRHAQRGRGGVGGEEVHAAFEAASGLARRCLGEGDHVTVDGAFDGPTGLFDVERVGSASQRTPERVRQCVAAAMERARVRPFRRARHAAQWTVGRGALAPLDAGTLPPVPEQYGSIDANVVARIIRGELWEFRRCYEDVLRADPTVQGRVELRFTISVDGRVSATSSRVSAPALRPVGLCIEGRVRPIVFPRPRGGPVDFSFSFTFSRAIGS